MDAKTLAALQKLSRRWKRKTAKERKDIIYGEEAAAVWLSQCAEELDELIDQQAAITALNGCVLPRTD